MDLPTERFDEVSKQQEAEKIKQGETTCGKGGKQQSAIAQQGGGIEGPGIQHSGPSYSQVVTSTGNPLETILGGDGGGQSGIISGN